MRYSDINKFENSSRHSCDVKWEDLEKHISTIIEDSSIEGDLSRDFLKENTWTKAESIAYVEYKLQGGLDADRVSCNRSGRIGDQEVQYQIIDGLQRVTAVRDFLADEFPVFCLAYYSEIKGKMPKTCRFKWFIDNLPEKADVLKWYIELNEGGRVHSALEIQQVRNLLEDEQDRV